MAITINCLYRVVILMADLWNSFSESYREAARGRGRGDVFRRGGERSWGDGRRRVDGAARTGPSARTAKLADLFAFYLAALRHKVSQSLRNHLRFFFHTRNYRFLTSDR